jgi:predicted nucleic acid-binding Zn ribbon protein
MNRKRRPPERIGAIVESILAERGYLSICKEQEAVRRWPDFVGERLAAVTECTGAERGVLYVRVRSAAWRNELPYLKEELLANVRKECNSIRDIVFS